MPRPGCMMSDIGPVNILPAWARVATVFDRQQPGGKSMSTEGTTRREVLKKAAYTTPILISLKANLELASAGSGLPAPSDRVITGGSGPTNPGTSTPGKSQQPPATPGPGNAPPPPRNGQEPGTSIPRGSQQPPAPPGPGNAPLLPQDRQETWGQGRRRWREWFRQWLSQRHNV